MQRRMSIPFDEGIVDGGEDNNGIRSDYILGAMTVRGRNGFICGYLIQSYGARTQIIRRVSKIM